MNWETELAAIRHQAALKCGLDKYPAELMAAFDAVEVPGNGWRRIRPDEQRARLARYDAARAEISSAFNLGSQLSPRHGKRKAPIGLTGA